MNSPPVKIGERLVVSGRPEKATVADITWIVDEARWVIVMDWGEFGKSRVYDHDENKTWFRYARVS